MRETVNGIQFFSDFDSGNLAKVETTCEDEGSETSKDLILSLRRQRSKSANNILNKRVHLKLSSSILPRVPSPRSRSYSNLDEILTFDGVELTRSRFDKTRKKSISSQIDNQSNDVCEFRLYTKNDCSGTSFENGNRTWFYFGVKAAKSSVKVRFNLMNLNKQGKLMSQGMAPVYKTVPGQETWKRIPAKPSFSETENDFILTFEHQLGIADSCTYFAFTYPYSYTECLEFLDNLEAKFGNGIYSDYQNQISDKKIYFSRELLCLTPKGRRVDLLTISSIKGIKDQREERLPHLFPETKTPISHKFHDKKVVFLSSRVHPGETQSSYVLNGFINFVLSLDPRAVCLRDIYLFKIVPILNPDGVAHGHYRTDLEGVNLNRKYLNCNPQNQPSVYALRSLLLYFHWEYSAIKLEESARDILGKFSAQLDKDNIDSGGDDVSDFDCQTTICGTGFKNAWNKHLSHKKRRTKLKPWQDPKYFVSPSSSGLAFYIDLHGHASKRGCFIFGNNFNHIIDKVDSMLLAKLMSINYQHFDLAACNFSVENMTHIGSRDKLSKEGSARVSIYYLTKIIRSYTLECNFNTGRVMNQLPPLRSGNVTVKALHRNTTPPKYTPKIFEEAGEALAISILDTTGRNPLSRLTLSPYRDLEGVKDWLMQYLSGGKTVSAWRHPRTRYFNAFKKSSIIPQNINEKAVAENAKNIYKKCIIHEPVKSRYLNSVKHQRTANLKIKEAVPKILVSHHEEIDKTFWLLPKQSSMTPLHSPKQKKCKIPITRSTRWRGSCDSLKDFSGSQLCILGTVCRPNSARTIRPSSVNI